MTSRGPYPGWSLVEDGYLDEPEPVVPEPPRRFGCLSFAVLFLVLVAGVLAPREAIDSPAASPVGLSSLGASDGENPAIAGPAAAVPVDRYPDDAPPSGAIGTALIGGYASWFDVGPGLYAAAGPLLREALGDWRGQYVTVEGDGASVTVRLSDWCACGSRHGLPTLIDLSRDAFAELADPSVGIVRVSIEIDPPAHKDDDRMRAEEFGPLPATSTER